MKKKLLIALLVGVAIFGFKNASYAAMCGTEESSNVHAGHMHSGHSHAQEAEPVDVGNEICPVTGEKINEKTKATYTYEGKIYNFCCPMCINDFKKDPEKYIDIINKEKEKSGVKQ